jgi:hypothetical protein
VGLHGVLVGQGGPCGPRFGDHAAHRPRRRSAHRAQDRPPAAPHHPAQAGRGRAPRPPCPPPTRWASAHRARGAGRIGGTAQAHPPARRHRHRPARRPPWGGPAGRIGHATGLAPPREPTRPASPTPRSPRLVAARARARGRPVAPRRPAPTAARAPRRPAPRSPGAGGRAWPPGRRGPRAAGWRTRPAVRTRPVAPTTPTAVRAPDRARTRPPRPHATAPAPSPTAGSPAAQRCELRPTAVPCYTHAGPVRAVLLRARWGETATAGPLDR